MFEVIRQWLYKAVTWSGLLIPIASYVAPMVIRLKLIQLPEGNHKMEDGEGEILRATKYNGKIYPPFGEDRFPGRQSIPIRDDDVIICGYPKTGCHWVYEILQMLVNKRIGLSKYGKELGGMLDALPQILLDSVPSPRVLNSHFRYEDLPDQIREKKTKIVLTVRSPKDTAVSYYNHHITLDHFYHYNGSFDGFYKLFVSGNIGYGSYFDYLLDWDKVMKAETDHPILVVEYEKLKANPLSVARDIAKFLEVSVSDEFLENVLLTCRFDKMKAKHKGHGKMEKLFRKGQVGDWRNWMTDAQSLEVDRMWSERMEGCFYQPQSGGGPSVE